LKGLLPIEPGNRGRGRRPEQNRSIINGILWRHRCGAPWRDEAVIPGRSNRRVKIEHDRALYKLRNRIERMFGHLKVNRAIATRCDLLASSFLGMVHLATARYWLKFVHAA
jgi:transposase